MKGAVVASDEKWRVEDDLRTLMAAREIQKDKSRMSAVKKLVGEKMAELKTLQGSASA